MLATLLPVLAIFGVSLMYPTDADIRRYFAYCNAVLGRPYDGFYVRTDEAWKRAFVSGDRTDLDEYARSGGVIRVGPPHPLLPYRDFLVEYPPGFFLAVLPPALLTRSVDTYKLLFGAWMSALLALAVWVCRQVAGYMGRAPTVADIALWTTIAVLALGKVTVQRYDALVALLLCIMCWATLARRPVLVGLSTGVAVAVKLVPVFAALVCGLYLIRQRRPRELLTAVVVAGLVGAAICAPAMAGGAAGLLSVVFYGLERPLEFESTAAALLGLWTIVEPTSAAVTFSYGSTNVVGRYAGAAIAVSSGAGLIAMALVYRATWRALASGNEVDRARVLVSAVLTVLAVVIAFAKVGSIQYLVWLIPLGLLAGLRPEHGPTLLVFIAALTLAQIGYPLASTAAESLEPWACAILLGRQVVLLVWARRVLTGGTS
ncbi:MAG: DUF2029 domain-containing protein [Luteitalea sp.]|nr:DUF2029 domain-containing protein [Luteitalea sp.]